MQEKKDKKTNFFLQNRSKKKKKYKKSQKSKCFMKFSQTFFILLVRRKIYEKLKITHDKNLNGSNFIFRSNWNFIPIK